jgi:hypothetical protein
MCSTRDEDEKLVQKIQWKNVNRKHGRRRNRWEYNINMNNKEGVDWIQLPQDTAQSHVIVNTAMTIGFRKWRGIS